MIDPLLEARRAGVVIYDSLSELDLDSLDPLIRPAVEAINASGWAWTAESCQGHPDAVSGCWAGNLRPMLRLVCRAEHEGAMWAALLDACRASADKEVEPWGRPSPIPLEVYPDERGLPAWRGTLVYLRGSTVGDRDRGCLAFRRFGELLQQRRPGA